MKSKWLFILAALLMVGCTVQKPMVEEAVRPNLFESDITLADSVSMRSWQGIFVDEPIQALISEALDSNADVRTMQLSVEQAAIQMRVAKLSYLPSFALSPSGTDTKANGTPVSTSYELLLTMSWELNLGGQVEASRKAVENSRELMRFSSSVTYLEELTAQSSWLNAQLQQTADWLELQQGKINLYEALCR